MRATHPSPQTPTRYAILLAALLGGIAIFGVVFASSGQRQPGVFTGGHSPLAYSGLPGNAAHMVGATHGAQPSGCTAGGHDIFGKDFVVDTRQWVCDHVTDYGGNITVLGHVSSDVVAVGGDIVVSGVVDGRALALGGNVTLLPGAHIGGDVQAIGGSVNRSPGVTVDGQVDPGITAGQFSIPNITTIIPVRLDWADVIFWAFSGLVISLFLPSQLIRVQTMARRQPIGSLFLGLLAYIIGLISAIVLVLTCLGIPLALAIGVVLWGGSIFGTAALGHWLGSALTPGARRPKRFPFVLATVIGVTLLAIASTAPFVGGVIRAVVSMVGLGAVLLTIATMRRPGAVRRRAWG
ncbi:MAG TPA: hypothetical protein VFQ32_07780 [Ktedonobacterales bacterium]|nr:hypothetical protein [Ktedonobacterales bacterium]